MKDDFGGKVYYGVNKEVEEYISGLEKQYEKPNNLPQNNNYKLISNLDVADNVNIEVENETNKPFKPKAKSLAKNKNKDINENIHKGHRKRLRGMFNNNDPLKMPEHLILEYMLSFVQPQKDVNPLAHKLLNEYGSFANVLNASIDDLIEIDGIGEVIASYIHFCSKIPAIYNYSKTSSSVKLQTANAIFNFVREKITFEKEERFYYLCLDNKCNLIYFDAMGFGSVSRVYVDNLKLVKSITKHGCSTVIICHTHPFGNPVPSEEDKLFTVNLYSLLEGMHIRLADHIILSPDSYFSFFENGTEALGENADLKSKLLYGMPINLLNADDFRF